MLLSDSKNICEVIDLYKKGKITKNAIELEINYLIRDMSPFGDVYAELEEKNMDTTSFGVVILPTMGTTKTDFSIILDKNAVVNMFSSELLVKILKDQLDLLPKISSHFFKFISSNTNHNFDLDDALIEYMELYLISLEGLISSCSNDKALLKGINTIEAVETELNIIKKNPDNSTETIERLKGLHILPFKMMDSAEKMTKSNSETLVVDIDAPKKPIFQVFGTQGREEPEIGSFFEYRKNITANTYDLYKIKTIDPNYKPDSNAN